MHKAEPAGAKVPAAHGAHAVASDSVPPEDDLPASHCTHCDVAVFRNCPDGHMLIHVVEPGCNVVRPAAHLVHSPFPAVEIYCTAQFVQVMFFELSMYFENFPAWQSTQFPTETDPCDVVVLPSKHLLQITIFSMSA